MIQYGRQSLELRPTCSLGATINFLQMRRALQVSVQISRGGELPMAPIALVTLSVPGVAGRSGLSLAPLEQVVGDEAVAVHLVEKAIDVLTFEAGGGLAAVSFKVVRDTAGCGKSPLAKWAGHLSALMDTGIEVPWKGRVSMTWGGLPRKYSVLLSTYTSMLSLRHRSRYHVYSSVQP